MRMLCVPQRILIPLCPKASRDKQQHTRAPGCSDGPIFIHVQEQQQDTLTKRSVEQQLWQGCAGLRFNSTATMQLCSTDSCPGIHQKLLEALSRSLQAQPHIARQFSFLLAPALSLNKTSHGASPGT